MLFLSLRPTLFLVQSRSLSGRHVSTSFLDPVLGAMMKQVFWHSRRSKAYRGLPEARMAASRLLRMCWSSPTAAKLGCAFSHSAERIVDELGLLYPENRGNLRKNMASV